MSVRSKEHQQQTYYIEKGMEMKTKETYKRRFHKEDICRIPTYNKRMGQTFSDGKNNLIN